MSRFHQGGRGGRPYLAQKEGWHPSTARIAAQHMDCQPDVTEGGEPPTTTINHRASGSPLHRIFLLQLSQPGKQAPKLDPLSSLSLSAQDGYIPSLQMLSPTCPYPRFSASPHSPSSPSPTVGVRGWTGTASQLLQRDSIPHLALLLTRPRPLSSRTNGPLATLSLPAWHSFVCRYMHRYCA